MGFIKAAVLLGAGSYAYNKIVKAGHNRGEREEPCHCQHTTNNKRAGSPEARTYLAATEQHGSSQVLEKEVERQRLAEFPRERKGW